MDFAQIRNRLAGLEGKSYWRSLEELADTKEFGDYMHREFPSQASEFSDPAGRRTFLKLMGASLALAGVGACTRQPEEKLIPYVRQLIHETGEDIKVDWHGHNDRGLAVINTITAMTSGADRVHATALGLGERVGNCSMDQLLVNLRLMNYINSDLEPLRKYVDTASEATGVPIPSNYPVFGTDAFRTATGVHAAAIIKAKKKDDGWLADRICSFITSSCTRRGRRPTRPVRRRSP